MEWDIMSFHFTDFQMQIMKIMTCGHNLFRRLDFFGIVSMEIHYSETCFKMLQHLVIFLHLSWSVALLCV